MGRPLSLSKFGDRSNLDSHTQIQVTAFVNGSAQAAYLLQQKNNNTFVVVDAATGTFKATVKFANTATPIVGQMSLEATTNASTTFFVSRITNRFAYDFSTPVVKFKWGFTLVADSTQLDHAQILNVSIPGAVKAASVNEAP